MQKMGVFWKIQDICSILSTEIFKIEEEMTEKMKPEVANPPSKICRIHFSHYALSWWSSAFSWLAMKPKLVPHIGRRWSKGSFVPLAWCVKFKDHNALTNGWEDQSMYIQSREFCPFLEGGLATLSFIFSVISSSNLKI